MVSARELIVRPFLPRIKVEYVYDESVGVQTKKGRALIFDFLPRDAFYASRRRASDFRRHVGFRVDKGRDPRPRHVTNISDAGGRNSTLEHIAYKYGVSTEEMVSAFFTARDAFLKQFKRANKI